MFILDLNIENKNNKLCFLFFIEKIYSNKKFTN